MTQAQAQARASALRNFGTLETTALIAIMNELYTLSNETVSVHIGDIFCSVQHTDNRILLTAARLNRKLWHVRCVPGLIIAKASVL